MDITVTNNVADDESVESRGWTNGLFNPFVESVYAMPDHAVPEAIKNEIAKLSRGDGTVGHCLRQGLPLEFAVVSLANQNASHVAQIRGLLAIAPRKYRLADGSVVVWNCPENLIPEQEA